MSPQDVRQLLLATEPPTEVPEGVEVRRLTPTLRGRILRLAGIKATGGEQELDMLQVEQMRVAAVVHLLAYRGQPVFEAGDVAALMEVPLETLDGQESWLAAWADKAMRKVNRNPAEVTKGFEQTSSGKTSSSSPTS